MILQWHFYKPMIQIISQKCHSVPEIVNGLDKGGSPSYRKMFSICKMKLVVITSVYVNFDKIDNGVPYQITKK